MELSNIVTLLVAVLIGIVVLLVIWAVMVRRRTTEDDEFEVPPESLDAVADARYDPGEQPASLVSEQIEEMVKVKLDEYPDLAEVKLDFGTGDDENLIVWVGEISYADIDQIPDERIRQAISEAVATFNR